MSGTIWFRKVTSSEFGDVLKPQDMGAKRKMARLKEEDVYAVKVWRPRSPAHWFRAHRFAGVLAKNIEEFAGLDQHRVLKRLQWETGFHCEEIGAMVGDQHVVVKIPKSLSFDDMDEDEFRDFYKAIARLVADKYWHGCDADQIEEMIKLMPEE